MALSPGPVLLRRFVRTKGEPLCDEVELSLDANPTYAHVRYPNGNESTVSTSDLAPVPAQLEQDPNNETPTHVVPATDVALLPTVSSDVDVDYRAVQNKDQTVEVTTAPDENARAETHRPRRSCRERRPPERFGEWTM